MAKKKAEAKSVHETEIQTSELAAIVGKSSRWIRQLVSDGVLKQTSRGKFILSEAIQAYIEHVQGGKEEDNKPRLVDHKTEHERIKTEKAALELAQMRGELHAAADVEAVMSDMLTAFRQKMLSIPTKLAPQLAGIADANVIKAKITNDVHEALAELADYNPGMFEEGATGVDVDAEA